MVVMIMIINTDYSDAWPNRRLTPLANE